MYTLQGTLRFPDNTILVLFAGSIAQGKVATGIGPVVDRSVTTPVIDRSIRTPKPVQNQTGYRTGPFEYQ